MKLPQPAKPSFLEDLPAELKLEVIRACPNIETLLALISASPVYLSIYMTNMPDSIFSNVALQELWSRGVVLDPRAQWIALRLNSPPFEHHRYGKYGMNPAIAAYYEAIENSTTNSIVLPRTTCRALLTIKAALSLWEETDKAGKLKPCSSLSPTLDCTGFDGAEDHDFWDIWRSWGKEDMIHDRGEGKSWVSPNR
ncbi:hypothetical protein G7Y79_00089g101180 [Physcia stellaris]|nr:hypothetical protein G7Y79_00089g101180 [Physcia stellaris]